MPKRRTVKKVSATELEFGDDFMLSGTVYVILDVVVKDTVLIEFVPQSKPFAQANMMIVQRDTIFLKFGPVIEEY